MTSAKTDRISAQCPCCDATLQFDKRTGAVLRHEPSKASPAGELDFDQLLADVDRDKQRAEAVFAREQAAHDNRERVLEARFEEALDRVDEADDGKPPPSPFDLD